MTFETLITFLTIENNNLNIHSDPWIKSDRGSIRNSCDVFSSKVSIYPISGLWTHHKSIELSLHVCIWCWLIWYLHLEIYVGKLLLGNPVTCSWLETSSEITFLRHKRNFKYFTVCEISDIYFWGQGSEMGFYFMKNEHFSHSGIIDIAKHYLTSLEIGMRNMGNIFNKNVIDCTKMGCIKAHDCFWNVESEEWEIWYLGLCHSLLCWRQFATLPDRNVILPSPPQQSLNNLCGQKYCLSFFTKKRYLRWIQHRGAI